MSYSATGSYSGWLAGDTVTGTHDESGASNTSYLYETNATLANGAWTETGSGHVTRDGGDSYSFSGGRSYTHYLERAALTIPGAAAESGSEDNSYQYAEDYTLDSAGDWILASGSGGASGSAGVSGTNPASQGVRRTRIVRAVESRGASCLGLRVRGGPVCRRPCVRCIPVGRRVRPTGPGDVRSCTC